MGFLWVTGFSFFHCVASPFHSFVTTLHTQRPEESAVHDWGTCTCTYALGCCLLVGYVQRRGTSAAVAQAWWWLGGWPAWWVQKSEREKPHCGETNQHAPPQTPCNQPAIAVLPHAQTQHKLTSLVGDSHSGAVLKFCQQRAQTSCCS